MKKTIIDAFEHSVSTFSDNTFLLEKVGKEWTRTTYKETQREVYRLGAGLQALGVSSGDNMALLSEGRNLWIISELAMFYAGAVNVPLSIKLEEAGDLLFRLEHSDARYVIVSGNQLRKIRGIIAKLPKVERVIVLDKQTEYAPKEVFVDDVMLMGDRFIEEKGLEQMLSVGQALKNDTLATITYTSGTTADPKGVCLTHRNYTANVEQSLSLIPIDDTWRTLIILPLDHCFAHVCGFYCIMERGASCATVQVGRTPMETLKNIPVNIREIAPDFILSVPALAKSFKKNIEGGIQKQGKVALKLFKWGKAVRQCYFGESNLDGKGWRRMLIPLVWLFDQILFNKVRAGFGGRMRFFVGGGALLDKDLQHFYIGIGLPMFQGYGLSEATPVISSNTADRYRFGSSGRLVSPIEVRICDDNGKDLPTGQMGEIVVKGENVMAGYWKNPRATADTVKDGWLYTGDLGYMSEEGLLYVKGRFKSLLISADGEKYSPEGIEESLVQHCEAIDQIMLYNNQSPITSALIVPAKDKLTRMGYDLSKEQGCRDALAEIDREIRQFLKGGAFYGQFPERWLPGTFAVLSEPFSEQNHMINSTMKLVRPKVEQIYKERLEYVYTSEGRKIDNPLNINALG